MPSVPGTDPAVSKAKGTARARGDPLGRAALGLGLLVLVGAPLVADAYQLSLLTEILILAIFASGLNLLLGYTGLVSLGHAAFLGMGGYVSAIVSLLWGFPVWFAMLAAALVTLVIAYLVGLVAVRTKGVQFLLITLAFGQLFYGLAEKSSYTGGDDGMTQIPRLDLSWLGVDAHSESAFYLVVLAFFLLALAFLWLVIRSPFGSTLVGIRENEKRMQALGYNTGPYKAVAFAFSGLVAGLAGSLWVQHAYFVNPHIVSWQMSGEVLLIVIIGGTQAFLGPLLGSAFYVLMKSYLATLTESYLLVFGLMFVLVVAFFKGGLAGFLVNVFSRARRLFGEGRR